MVIVSNRIEVEPDQAAEFEQRFVKRLGGVDQAPGFMRYVLLKPLQSGLPYQVITVWQTQADFEAWVASSAFRQAHSGARGGTASSLEIYSLIQEA
jgi:heme-degrading monooxygenase HmoA